jgi:single-strand DNA-binding protein
MAGSLNKVFLMGNLTRDPELRYTPGGAAVTDLPIAVNRSWTGKDGERKEEVLFVDVTVWDRQAETCCQYLKKGRSIHVEGSLKMESWDDKTSGEKRTKLKVLADRVQFLDRREDGPGGPPTGDADSAPARDRESGPARRAPAGGNGAGRPIQSGPTPSAAPRRPAAPPVDNDSEDEDIPF